MVLEILDTQGWPSKNIIGLIEAYSRISTDKKLVIAGGKGWYYKEIFEKVKELKVLRATLKPYYYLILE